MTYLDYNASTPLDPRVRDAMVGALDDLYGNASSVQHGTGQAASRAIETARAHVSSLVGAYPSEVIFTSGASEAITLAILGAVLGSSDRPDVVVTAVEHKATLEAAKLATRLSGGQVKIAPVTPSGALDRPTFGHLVTSSVAVVAVMHANNETGVINDVLAASDVAHDSGALMLCDATQSVGKIKVDSAQLGADILTFSSHKMYGPKGAGALVAQRDVLHSLLPVFPGGGQERGLRGGTHDTAAIVGFGEAAHIAAVEYEAASMHAERLMQRFLSRVTREIEGVLLMGSTENRIPNTANLRFIGADAEALMASMADIEVSTGSACQAAVPTVSHVLSAMGLTRAEASECLRFSFGRPTTEAEIGFSVDALKSAVGRVRSMTAA